MSSIPEKRKSTGSGKLRRTSSKRSRRSNKSETSETLDNISSRDISIIEEDEILPPKPINYREELTFLFFNWMLEEKTVETREILPPPDLPDPGLCRTCLSPTLSKDFRDINENDLKDYNVVGVTASKVVLEKSKQKTRGSLINQRQSILSQKSSSVLQKKSRSSKQKVLREGSLNISEGSRSSRRGTIQSIEEGLEWVLRIDDQNEEIVFKNGNIYNGETSRTLMHGKGTFHWADGTVYEGLFRNGYPDGTGQVILPDLSIYEGDFFRGYFHGNGVLRITGSPAIYSGSWKHGMRHGKGWLLWEPKTWYDGDWANDNKHGFGYRRYKNGARYKGMWANDKKNGEGSMIWENNDYYVGEWVENKPDGYGEYTWNLYFNKSFIFPYYNWYKGSWLEGERTGAGIMDFGTHSGAKLAGIWVNNQKHGAGVMICGNGKTLERNPLFENDKPVHMSSSRQSFENVHDESKTQSTVLLSEMSGPASKPYDESEEKIELEKETYKHILKEINSKVAVKTFGSDILTHITKSGLNISATKFVKLKEDEIPEYMNTNKWCPLEISIHTIAEEVDISYYIDIIIDYYFEKSQKDLIFREFEYVDTNVNTTNDSDEPSTPENENKKELVKQHEERLVRHLITAYLPQLTDLYDKYASFVKNEEITFKPVLIRMFFWQLLRDIGLPQQAVTLLETDLFLANNPASCIETDHYPFEPIYFWQFLQALLGCSWLLFLTKEQTFDSFTNGIIAQILKQFLDYDVFPNAGKFEGYALTEYKDLLPIKSVYDLYLKIGEPHTVRDFLYHSWVKKGKKPPCYVTIKEEHANKDISEGNNAVMLGHKIMYLEVKKYVTSSISIPDENPDIFSKSLYTFRGMGKRKIISCMAKVCPNIITADGSVDLEYKLVFLEFYEIVLQCAYEKVDRKRRIEEKQKQKEYLELLEELQAAADDKAGKKKKPNKK